jgi:hypothetical protein
VLLLVHLLHRRLIALEQRRSEALHPPLGFFEHLRQPHGSKELVSPYPMAGGMKPDPVLVHCLWAHRHLDLLFAPSGVCHRC